MLKKIFKGIILITLIVTSTKLAIIAAKKKFSDFVFSNDVSMQQKAICNNLGNTKVWLVSYAGGKEVHYANQSALVHSSINKCIHNTKSYNYETLDKNFVEKNKEILSLPRGNGYWLWKPHIILDTLNQIPEGDIILYVDSGTTIIASIDSLLNNLGNKDILAFENGHTNKKYIKRDLLRIMNMDTEGVRDSNQLMGSDALYKNNKFTRDFVKQWLELCENKLALTDIPSEDEYPEFYDHRHDQAIFTLLSLKYRDNFKILPHEDSNKYFYHHRRRTLSRDLKLLPQYWPMQDSNMSSRFFYWLLKKHI